MSEPAILRAGAETLRDPNRMAVLDPDLAALIADWLDCAAYDAEQIGTDWRAFRVASRILGRPDPWPDAPPPAVLGGAA